MASVDVVVPCYQHGAYLGEAVRSALRQHVGDLRVLIVDNASTDDSVDVARRLAAEDPRVTVRVHEHNLGLHASLNEGIDWAAGDYVMVLCADDALVAGALERAVAVLDAHPWVGLAYGADLHLGPDDPLPDVTATPSGTPWRLMTGDEFLRHRFRHPSHYINSGMFVARTSSQRQAGPYRDSLRHATDLEMMLRIATVAGVASTTAVIGTSRVLPTSLSSDLFRDRTGSLRELLLAHESFLDHEGRARADADDLAAAVRRGLAERAYWSGVKDLLRRRPTSRELFDFAFELEPRMRRLPPLGYLATTDRGLRAQVAPAAAAVRRRLRRTPA